MRDPNRIPRILKHLQDIWERNPDLRLGQLIENVFPNTEYDFISAYYLEDEDFLKALEEYYSKPRIYRRFGKMKRVRK
jgi:uncharacterized protein YihD (DUF1040 family)